MDSAGNQCQSDRREIRGKKPDVVDAALAADFLSTLVSAVKQAGLVETLKQKGPFTVFAPSDEAFAKLDKGQLEALSEDKETLVEILTYHVVPGSFDSEALKGIDRLKTLQGGSLQVETEDGVRIGGTSVSKADVRVRNGIIHVIDNVLLPKSE